MTRQRTIKVSQEEYDNLKRAQKELEERKKSEMSKALPSSSEAGGIDWGSVALGAVASLGALALLDWLARGGEGEE